MADTGGSKPAVVPVSEEGNRIINEKRKMKTVGSTEYLTRGATLHCDMGTHDRKLNLLEGHEIVFYRKDDEYYAHPMVAESEIVLEENVCYFGICKSATPPQGAPTVRLVQPVQAGDENAQPESAGFIDGIQCIPKILGGWLDTKEDVVINIEGTDKKVLLKSSCLVCANMGLIEPIDSGMNYSGESKQKK